MVNLECAFKTAVFARSADPLALDCEGRCHRLLVITAGKDTGQGTNKYRMSRRSPVPVLTREPTLALRAKDLFAEPLLPPPPAGRPTRHRLPRQGEAMTARSPEGLMVRVEHRDDGSWWLMLPDRMENATTTVITYPLVVQPMSVPKRRLIRQRDGTYRLPPGMRHPVRFLIQDSTGRRVRNLYLADDGRIGSAHELGWIPTQLNTSPRSSGFNGDRTRSGSSSRWRAPTS